MRYAKLSCTEFYPCYLLQCHSIDLFSYRIKRVIWIRSIRSSIQKFSWNWLFSFFWELSMVLEAMWCCVWQSQIFWKKCFTPEMGKLGQAQGSLNVRKVQFFFLVLYLFLSLVYNESSYYCNFCMLEQISYLEKFWFLKYGPKCSWRIRLQDFSINRRTLNLAVSHKEINEINWFLVCPSNSFLRNDSLGCSDFWHTGR